MNLKQKRLDILGRIIASSKAGNQEDILSMLEAEGFVVTQATLSRDLKELKVAKMPDGQGGYRYVLPEGTSSQKKNVPVIPVSENHIGSGVVSIEFSGQMCVLKTRPGYANMIAAIIDGPLNSGIMGSIAGDDTILLILREKTDAEMIMSEMERVIPGISVRRI